MYLCNPQSTDISSPLLLSMVNLLSGLFLERYSIFCLGDADGVPDLALALEGAGEFVFKDGGDAEHSGF